MSRDKGADAEREVVQLVRAAGWTVADRNWRSGGGTVGGDIAGGPASTVIEVKRVEAFRLRDYWAQVAADAERAGPGVLPILAHRWSRGPWLGITELDELLALLWQRERR